MRLFTILLLACLVPCIPGLAEETSAEIPPSTKVPSPTTPAEAFEYFPLQIGNRWIYHCTYTTTPGEGKYVCITWVEELEVVEHVEVPHGLVVLMKRTCSQVGRQYPGLKEGEERQWYEDNIPEPKPTHFLIEGNRIFEVYDGFWDTEKRQLTETYLERQASEPSAPEYVVPMDVGMHWSDSAREKAARLFEEGKGPAPLGNFFWRVEARDGVEIPALWPPETFRLEWYDNTGGLRRWFANGVGLVKESSTHQGTQIGQGRILVQFIPVESENL